MLGCNYTRFFLAAGQGVAPWTLNAIDCAYLDAGVGDTNLFKLSSILPPKCKQVNPVPLSPGDLQPIACALQPYDPDMFIQPTVMAAAVAVAIPADPNDAGLIMEHHGFFNDIDECERTVRQMCEWGMIYRKRPFKEILSKASVMKLVDKPKGQAAAVFAAVVLLP